MKKRILICTFNFNNQHLTDNFFLKSIFKNGNIFKNLDYEYEILIVDTSHKIKYQQSEMSKECRILYLNEQNIHHHHHAIDYILNDQVIRTAYDGIILCDNDTIIKSDIKDIIDFEYFSCGQIIAGVENGFRLLIPRIHPMFQFINFNFIPKDRHIFYHIPAQYIQPYIADSLKRTIDNKYGLDKIFFNRETGSDLFLFMLANKLKYKNIVESRMQGFISHLTGGNHYYDMTDAQKSAFIKFENENKKYL